MKRFISFCLVVILLLTLCCCGGKKEGQVTESGNTSDVSSADKGENKGFLGGLFGGGDGEKKGNSSSEEKPVLLKNLNPTDPSIYTRDVVSEMQLGKNLGMLDSRESTSEIEKAADNLLKKIEACPDTVKAQAGGKTYYVSNKGDDKNDGLSPESPLATIQKATLKTQSGDAVLLKRGSFWREVIKGKDDVSYGAYGNGNKPTLYGSIDGVKLEWKQDTSNKNIWVADVGTSQDVGLIVFNHGKAFANPKLKKEQVIQDFNFYYDKRTTSVYLYYSKGKPTEYFYSIEIGPDVTMIVPGSNSTVQNIRMMYTGGFGVSYSYEDNVTIQGCIMGYMGGSIMNGDVRYGNAIQLWGACDGMYVDRCHIYQIYDAGITPQCSSGGKGLCDVTEKNIKYTNNLVEYCVYSIEYFLRDTTGSMKNIEISNNVLRYAGYGWGTLARPGKYAGTHIRAASNCRLENFVIKDNIFDHANPTLIRNEVKDNMPKFSGNTYATIGNKTLLGNGSISYKASDCKNKTAEEIFGDKIGKIIIFD